MYQWLYNVGISAYGLAITIASLFNSKAKLALRGRKNLLDRISRDISPGDEVLWFHAASLGEAEMGLPIIQETKKRYPQKKILLTFFSPSGFEHFHHPEIIDYKYYLPLDKPKSVKRFLDIVNPQLAFFIKYEIWANFFKEIQKREIPLIVAPAIFRASQFYFKKPHRKFFLPILKKINRMLVQDENSKDILHSYGISHVEVCGDSRFERVVQNVKTPFENILLETFSYQQQLIVAGSTWAPDEKILKTILDQNPQLKLIMAPHDIAPENIDRIISLFGEKIAFRYSEPPEDPTKYRVCVINNIGMLSRIYRYGQIAYIGGGFGKGLHNSLEAVAYGLPVFFGPNHQNFIEPTELIKEGIGFEIKNGFEMQSTLNVLLTDKAKLNQLQTQAEEYTKAKAGAVLKITRAIEKVLA